MKRSVLFFVLFFLGDFSIAAEISASWISVPTGREFLTVKDGMSSRIEYLQLQPDWTVKRYTVIKPGNVVKISGFSDALGGAWGGSGGMVRNVSQRLVPGIFFGCWTRSGRTGICAAEEAAPATTIQLLVPAGVSVYDRTAASSALLPTGQKLWNIGIPNGDKPIPNVTSTTPVFVATGNVLVWGTCGIAAQASASNPCLVLYHRGTNRVIKVVDAAMSLGACVTNNLSQKLWGENVRGNRASLVVPVVVCGDEKDINIEVVTNGSTLTRTITVP